ncbi:MAG: hypothetical protein Q9204_009255, partial [Flavoplaca sp. TL-2023a]
QRRAETTIQCCEPPSAFLIQSARMLSETMPSPKPKGGPLVRIQEICEDDLPRAGMKQLTTKIWDLDFQQHTYDCHFYRVSRVGKRSRKRGNAGNNTLSCASRVLPGKE